MKKKHEKKKAIIDKKMTFAEIMHKNPKAAEILMNKGMYCIGCHMAMHETLEQGAFMHGMNPDKLVKELNKNKEVKKIDKTMRKKKK